LIVATDKLLEPDAKLAAQPRKYLRKYLGLVFRSLGL